MAIEWIFAFFGWIVRTVKNYLNPIERPTDDLEEKAKCEIERRLNEIRQRNVHEIDARRYEPECIPRSSKRVEVPKSTDSFIKFNAKEVIQEADEPIFGGWVFNRRVAFKMIGYGQKFLVASEMKIAEKLKNHENFLHYFFSFDQENLNFIAMEFYEQSVAHLQPPDLRDFLKQVCSGLWHMHNLDIAHRSLIDRNIAIVMRGSTPIYKITNFKDSLIDSTSKDEEYLKDDVESLGKLLLKLRDRQQAEGGLKKWTTADDVLCVSLVNKMTARDWNQRPSVSEVMRHPFLWSAHETLHFILEIAKKLESNRCVVLFDLLKSRASKIFTSDWRGYIDRFVVDELRDINFDKLPFPNIVGLIKTIRNLTVHHRTTVMEKAMGRTEDELLRYWTKHFPRLVIQVYECDKSATRSKIKKF